MTITALRTRLTDDDRGNIVLWWAISFLTLLIVLGLVVDGGGKLHTDQQAQLAAEEAARGAGQSIVKPLSKRGVGLAVDPFMAAVEAERYLAQAGVQGVAVPTGPTTILITTTKTYTPKILSIIGMGPQTVTGQATVNLNRTNTGGIGDLQAGLP